MPVTNKTICQSIVIPAKNGVKHWTALRDQEEVSADITNATNITKSQSARNGSALWYSGTYTDPGQASRIGIFKDNLPKPNIYYFVDLNSPRGQSFIDKQIINGGRGINLFILEKPNSRKADQIWTDTLRQTDFYSSMLTLDKRHYLNLHNFRDQSFDIEDWIYVTGGKGSKNTGFGFSNPNRGKFTTQPPAIDSDAVISFSPIRMMMQAEINNYHWNKPVVFALNSESLAAWNFNQAVSESFNIIIKILPVFGAAAGKVADYLTKAINTYKVISTKGMTADGSMMLVNSLAQMADFIAPETVKGIRSAATEQYGKILAYAKNSVSDLFQSYDPYTVPNSFQNAAKKLNTSVEWLKNIYNNYSDDLNGYVNIVNKFSGDQFNEAKNAIQNVKNIMLLDHANRLSRKSDQTSSVLVQQVTSSRNINDVPILRDMFVAGSANTILPTLPNADELTKAMIANHSEEIQAKGSQGKELEAMMTTMSFGYTPPSQVFDEFALDALKREAGQALEKGLKYVVPDSIPAEKKECYVYELESTGASLIPCLPGYSWDHTLRKCKANNASMSVGIDLSSKNLLIAGGIVASGLLLKKVIKG